MEKPQKELVEALDQEYDDWEAYVKVLKKLFALNDKRYTAEDLAKLAFTDAKVFNLKFKSPDKGFHL